jgi:histidinol phosphatase-like enzyme
MTNFNIDLATSNYTIFCDLDGTIWEQGDPTEISKPGYQPKIIHGTIDKIREWYQRENINVE